MTLASQMLTDVADVFLNTDEHAGAYVYTPPLNGKPRTVTGVWDLKEPSEDKANGLEVVHTATLLVATSESFERDGVLIVNSEIWVVTEVGTDNVGMRAIGFRRNDKIRSNASGRKYGQ
jgi:hypothetical protein